MGALAYLLDALPNAIVLVAALMIGLFPKWVIGLEKRPRLRWTIAGVLGILAVAIWVTSAIQMRSLDSKISGLETNQEATTQYQQLHQQMNAFEARTPTIPKMDFHFSNEGTGLIPAAHGFLFGFSLTLNNDGDDASYHGAQAIGKSITPTISSTYDNIRKMRQHLGNLMAHPLHSPPVVIRHGESKVMSVMIPMDGQEINRFSNYSETVIYGFGFDLRTAHGREIIFYCGFYQGMLPVNAPENLCK